MIQNAIIVGAGLAGLSAGIRLAMLGKQVLILEKNARAGGLCKSIKMDGKSFELGCNGFGLAIEDFMRELEVNQKFIPISHKLIFLNTNKELSIPFNLPSLWTLLYPLAISRMLYNVKYAKETDTLQDITRNLNNTDFRNMLQGFVAGTLFRPVEDISLRLIKDSLKNDFGYENPRIAVGGTKSLVGNMLNRYESLGGKIQYNMECRDITLQQNKLKKIRIFNNLDNDTYFLETDTVLSSAHGWQKYPTDAKPSLSISAFLFSLKNNFEYSKGIHTTMFFPENVQAWLRKLEQGKLPQNFGFHCFKNYPANVISTYFLSPRGVDEYTLDEIERLRDYITKAIDRKMPGFYDAIIKTDFYSPGRYKKELGMQSTASPCIPPQKFKLPIYDPNNDVYYIGNATNAIHEQHSIGALLSAKRAVAEVFQRENLSLTHDFDQTRRKAKRFSYLLPLFLCSGLFFIFSRFYYDNNKTQKMTEFFAKDSVAREKQQIKTSLTRP